MNVFDISAKIALDTSEYIKSLGDASSETSSFGDKMKGAFSTSMKLGAAAIGAVVTETVALSGALVKGVNDLAAYGDHIDKQSQKMNMSAQAYQEWDAIMQHSGTSIDSMQASMKTLANAAESDNEAFITLGMSLEEVKQMSSEELFSKTITALQNVESDTQRTYLAGQLLGRGATELGALLNTSAEDTEKMRQRVHELGGVMSDEAVKAAAKYEDSLQDMKTAMSGMTRSIKAEFLPSFTDVMDGLTSIFAGEEGGAEKVSKGIDAILGNISSAVGKMKPTINKIGGIVVSAVKENAPKLIKEGTQILGDIVVSTIQSLPDILTTAGDVLSGIGDVAMGYLPDWLSDDVKSIISSVKDMIGGIDFDTIKEKISSLAESLEPLAEKLSGGIAWAFENVVKPFGEWLMNSAIPVALDVFKGVLDNINNALTILEPVGKAVWEEFFKPLFSGIGDLAVGTFDLFGKALKDIAETFKDFDTIGFIDDIMQGNFGEDWMIGIKDIGKTIEGLGEKIDDFFSANGPAQLWNELWQNIGGAIFDAKEIITGAIDAIIKGIDDLVGKITSLPSKWYDFWSGFGEYLATDKEERNMIPAFGDGGRVTRPTLAIVGEKEPETIVPDSKRDQFMGGSLTINYYYQGGSGMSDAEIEAQARKLAELSIAQIRAIGGTGF